MHDEEIKEAVRSRYSAVAKDSSREFIKEWVPGRKFEDYVVSANITARKP